MVSKSKNTKLPDSLPADAKGYCGRAELDYRKSYWPATMPSNNIPIGLTSLASRYRLDSYPPINNEPDMFCTLG